MFSYNFPFILYIIFNVFPSGGADVSIQFVPPECETPKLDQYQKDVDKFRSGPIIEENSHTVKFFPQIYQYETRSYLNSFQMFKRNFIILTLMDFNHFFFHHTFISQ